MLFARPVWYLVQTNQQKLQHSDSICFGILENGNVQNILALALLAITTL